MAESSIPSYGRWPPARCSPWRGRAATALAACLLSTFPHPGTAQTVLGRLTDDGSGAAVEGALILLLDQAGKEAGGYLTNQAGRFIIRAPGPGSYTLRAERIGYETVNSETIQLEPGQQFGIELRTSETAIELEGIRVEGDQRCVVRPGEGEALANVWEEARKALTVQNWTEKEGLYRFQITRYERRLEPDARTVQSETRRVQSGVSGTPIRSLPVDDLLTNGFVRRNSSGGHDYFGPDASVLLSDRFLDTHCFSLAVASDRQGEVGLAFEPVSRGGIPDISGTLWLDANTADLKFLEYGYTWSPWAEAVGVARGRVEFERLPNGAWVIPRWWIRMPLMAENFSVSPDNTARIRLVGLQEVGGQISRISTLGDAVVSETPAGVLEGQVWDSTRQAPLAGATVFLSGTQYAAETDDGGNFLISGLPGGVFTAVFTHPRLDSLGTHSRGVEVEITPGDFTSLQLAIPPEAALFESTCSVGEMEAGTAMVLGFVRDRETEAPIQGASVSVVWSTFERDPRGGFVENREGFQTLTDSTGRYSVCGVPFDTTLRVQATYQRQTTDSVEAWAEEDGYTVVNLILPGGIPMARGPTPPLVPPGGPKPL